MFSQAEDIGNKTEIRPQVLTKLKAGALGVEPRSTASKAGVLPLHHAPVCSGINFNTKYSANQRGYMHENPARIAKIYFNAREKTEGALFTSREIIYLKYSALRMMFRQRCKRANVPNQTAHSFRRLFALSMLRNGVDMPQFFCG